jgi:hypothetical protein
MNSSRLGSIWGPELMYVVEFLMCCFLSFLYTVSLFAFFNVMFMHKHLFLMHIVCDSAVYLTYPNSMVLHEWSYTHKYTICL